MSFHASSHTTFTCPPADSDWALNELGISSGHFTLRFLGRPSTRSGEVDHGSNLSSSADSEESEHCEVKLEVSLAGEAQVPFTVLSPFLSGEAEHW